MIGRPANRQRLHLVLSRDTSDKRPKLFQRFVWNRVTPFLRAEYSMHVLRGVRVAHRFTSTPFNRPSWTLLLVHPVTQD